MALSEKALKDIQRSMDKQNALVLKLYRQSGDKDLLSMLYINTDNADELAEEFGISVEDAMEIIEKDKKVKEDPIGTLEAATEKLNNLGSYFKNLYRAAHDEGDTPETDESLANEEADSGEDDNSDYEDDDCDESRIFHDPLCAIQEALCFIGDVVSDTAEKICDALDESVERIMDHDFDE